MSGTAQATVAAIAAFASASGGSQAGSAITVCNFALVRIVLSMHEAAVLEALGMTEGLVASEAAASSSSSEGASPGGSCTAEVDWPNHY